MPDEFQIPPELAAAAKRLGLDLGGWSEAGARPVGSGIAEKQKELLVRLRGAMEQVQARDMKTVAELREKLARLQHGGGS